jgi:hypothetical protein
MLKTVGLAAASLVVLISYANAQEPPAGCGDLTRAALASHHAALGLMEASDDLKDVAMSRFKSGANYQRPTQQSFTKLSEGRAKMAEGVATLDKAVARNCGQAFIDLRDDMQDNLETFDHSIATMRKAAPALGVRLKG